MMTDQFEKAFSDYLDSTACDQAQDKLFAALRAAFFRRMASRQGK